MLLWISFGGILDRWFLLDTLPDKGVKIVHADYENLYIRTVSGKVYACPLSQRRECWFETDQIIKAMDPYPCTIGSAKLDPPGKIVDRADVYLCGPDGATEKNYALLEDGSVWVREYGIVGTPIGLLVFYGTPIVIMISFLFGLAALSLAKRFRNR
jgi:hypothetical protein